MTASKSKSKAEQYEAHKLLVKARDEAISKAGRDIGKLPDVQDPKRRLRCERDFKLFCLTYFSKSFTLAFSPDHERVIAKIEGAVLHGQLFAMAMPRGSGKTTLSEIGGLWGMIYGHRHFVALIGSDESSAAEMLDSIKMEIEGNDLLLEDFPEVCYPIRKLEGIALKAKGQTHEGRRTYSVWKSDHVIIPTIEGSKASGSVIKCSGITGRIRGMKHKKADGTPIRPDLVIIDDPQTDESARSPSQCETRERVLAGAILGLAGPGQRIAGIMPCTVIAVDDMADRILDKEKHPRWQGERAKMVYQFPKNEKIWDEYREILEGDLRTESGTARATKFYADNRKKMDEGIVVGWPERFDEDEEISAIQHAMNLMYRDREAFFAEYQNEPINDDEDNDQLTEAEIVKKLSGIPRSTVPSGATRLTAFIDVQKKCLYYVVCAWADDFTGYVIDYGTWPDQERSYFPLRDVKKTLAMKLRGAGLEGQIFNGLEKLVNQLCSREWPRDGDGSKMRMERVAIDANWGTSTETVYQFCRQSTYSNLLVPTHGRFVGASSKPFSEYKRMRGERIGLNWRMPNVKGKRAIRHCLYDTNFWKSFIQARLATAKGDRGSLLLFGRKEAAHRMLAEHLTAEYKIRTEGRGRAVDEWKQRPDRPDNHLLDCLVGCAVMASMQGVALEKVQLASKTKRKKKRSMAELMRKRS